MSCFWGIWPPPSPLPLPATGLELKLQLVVVDDGIHKSRKKDLSFLEISLQLGWHWVCVACRWWQEELWCSGAVQEEEEEGMNGAVINSRLCSLPCSVRLSGQCDWPAPNLANGLGLGAWLHLEQQF